MSLRKILVYYILLILLRPLIRILGNFIPIAIGFYYITLEKQLNNPFPLMSNPSWHQKGLS